MNRVDKRENGGRNQQETVNDEPNGKICVCFAFVAEDEAKRDEKESHNKQTTQYDGQNHFEKKKKYYIINIK